MRLFVSFTNKRVSKKRKKRISRIAFFFRKISRPYLSNSINTFCFAGKKSCLLVWTFVGHVRTLVFSFGWKDTFVEKRNNIICIRDEFFHAVWIVRKTCNVRHNLYTRLIVFSSLVCMLRREKIEKDEKYIFIAGHRL